MFYAIISMLFAGITSVIAKFGMKDLSSDTALVIRTAVVFSIILVNAILFRNAFSEIHTITTKNILFLAVSGLTTSLSWIFYYKAIKEGPVSYVAAIDKASILITLLLSFMILREPITLKLFAAACFIFIGLLLLIWK